MTGFPPEFFPGYVAYVAAIFLPGYGLWELLGRWREGDTLTDRVGLSFGVGIAVDTAVLAVKTLGVGVSVLYGAGIGVVYFLIFLGIAALGASYARRRCFTAPPAFTRIDFAVILLATFIGGVIALYFTKFPIFPYFNPDFLAHDTQTVGLVQGTIASVPTMLVYGSADYQLALTLLTVGGIPLVTMRHTMDVLTVISPFLVFAVTKRILARQRAALFATAIFALSGTVWAPLVLYDGLYANFVGVLLELLLIVAFLDLASAYRSPSVWVSSGIILVAGYFSHYTVISLFGSLLIFSLAAALLRRPSSKGYLVATAVFLTPGALGAVMFRHSLLAILQVSYFIYAPTPYTTYLSRLLSPVPSVAYIAVDVSNDIGLVALFALLVVALYWTFRSRNLPALLLAIWFVGLLVASPESGAAWRFAFEAIVPVILLAGYGLDSLLLSGPGRVRVERLRLTMPRSPTLRRVGMVAVCLLFLVPMAYGGTAWATAQNATTGTHQEAQVQGQILDAMTWMSQNTSPTSLVLSVTDPRFIFARSTIDRIASDHYAPSPTASISFAKAHGESYIVVTRYDVDTGNGTIVGDDPSLPWHTYQGAEGLTLVYSNPDVVIFEVESA